MHPIDITVGRMVNMPADDALCSARFGFGQQVRFKMADMRDRPFDNAFIPLRHRPILQPQTALDEA